MHVAGFAPDRCVFVVVQGQNSQRRHDEETADVADNDKPVWTGKYSTQRIYSGRIGASPSGEVESDFDIALAGGPYDQFVVRGVILDGKHGQEVEGQIMFDDQETGCVPERS